MTPICHVAFSSNQRKSKTPLVLRVASATCMSPGQVRRPDGLLALARVAYLRQTSASARGALDVSRALQALRARASTRCSTQCTWKGPKTLTQNGRETVPFVLPNFHKLGRIPDFIGRDGARAALSVPEWAIKKG